MQLNFDDAWAVYYIQPDLLAQLRWKMRKHKALRPSTISRLYNHADNTAAVGILES